MPEWKNNGEFFSLIKATLYTPVVGDILDQCGRCHQFLPQPIGGPLEGMKAVGRAMPAVMMDVDGPQQKPFGLLTEALDDLKPGEVYVCGDGTMRCAYWGELLTATTRMRGAAGAVIDGFHRDTRQVLEQDWPVFSRGRYAQDSAVRAAVTAFRNPMEMRGVWIEPGDLVFGDVDGVVMVPRALEAEIVTRALDKARGGKIAREAIEGCLSATDAFRKFGIW